MTKAEELQAKLDVLRELVGRARGRSGDESWQTIASDMAEDLDRELQYAKRLERRANGLPGHVATRQQQA